MYGRLCRQDSNSSARFGLGPPAALLCGGSLLQSVAIDFASGQAKREIFGGFSGTALYKKGRNKGSPASRGNASTVRLPVCSASLLFSFRRSKPGRLERWLACGSLRHRHLAGSGPRAFRRESIRGGCSGFNQLTQSVRSWSDTRGLLQLCCKQALFMANMQDQERTFE